VSVLLSKTRFLLTIRGVQMGVVIEFARAVHARVEGLGLTLVALTAIGIEQVATLVRENDGLVVFVWRNGPDQTFVARWLRRFSVRRVKFAEDSEDAPASRRIANVLLPRSEPLSRTPTTGGANAS
jgi:hypothetical protein